MQLNSLQLKLPFSKINVLKKKSLTFRIIPTILFPVFSEYLKNKSLNFQYTSFLTGKEMESTICAKMNKPFALKFLLSGRV